MTKKHLRPQILFVLFAIWSAPLTSYAQNQQSPPEIEVDPPAAVPKRNPLDKSLQPNNNDEISTLFENVVAVQRKAKVKAGKFLFNPYFSMDFSDAPYTMYGLNLNFGYALGEFWEVYFNYTPSYISNKRSIAKKVDELGVLANGQKAEVVMEQAKSSMGVEINWVPIYGKDSWGPYGIIRSDTFFSFGLHQMKYEASTGMKYKLSLGKTFFLSDLFNLRFMAGVAQVETVANAKKEGITIGLIEAGTVFYF